MTPRFYGVRADHDDGSASPATGKVTHGRAADMVRSHRIAHACVLQYDRDSEPSYSPGVAFAGALT